jgi:CRP-like cAMP-binding protein
VSGWSTRWRKCDGHRDLESQPSAVFKKGDEGDQRYVVRSGEVAIGDGNHVFETVSAGGILGEMALVAEQPRSATARAITQAQVADSLWRGNFDACPGSSRDAVIVSGFSYTSDRCHRRAV